jgi:cyclic pyranopterin phosphate synthase
MPMKNKEDNPKTNSVITDRYGRTLNYLRVSVTDRCNHRCTYCAPSEDEFARKKRSEILDFHEIARVVRLMANLGVTKVRLTGGEPLVRKDIEKLVGWVSEMRGIKDLAMTTNATLLKKYARTLAENGLNRINISIDTLDPTLFRTVTGGGELKPVLEGIDAAIEAGLTPIKLNTVIMRGVNDHELASIIDFAAGLGVTVRFIEFMPMREGVDWKKFYIPIEDILKRDDIKERVDTTVVADNIKTGEKAAAYSLPLRNAEGTAGFISPMSNRFCDACNRLRLTADGRLRSCLPADQDVDLRAALRDNASEADLIMLIKKAVLLKPEEGEYNYGEEGRKRSMIDIGG